MKRDLPKRPNLAHLKAQAKDLLALCEQRDKGAFARAREALPAAHGKNDAAIAAMGIALHDAQSIVAREYGFVSWTELRAHVESLPQAAEEPMAPATMEALFRAHTSGPLPEEDREALRRAALLPPREASLDAPLPVMPIRDALLVVGAVAPFHLARPSSVSAIRAAEQQDSAIAVFAQRDPLTQSPSESDLFPVGCAAHILGVTSPSEHTVAVVVRGAAWIKLEAMTSREPHLVARVSAFTVNDESSPEVDRLAVTLRERMHLLAEKLPTPDALLRRIERMKPRELADAAIANAAVSVAEKATYAAEPALAARLERALHALPS